MVKIIGIFAIVFVYYCEINAEVANLQSRKTPAADVRRIWSSKKKFAGNKSGVISLRSNTAQPHAKFTTGLREDKEYILRHGEPNYNDLEHHVFKKRRFKRSYRDEENKQIDEHDNETKNPKKRKRHHHHSRRKMNKNHNSTRNMKTKRYKNTKRNDMEEKDNDFKNKKHHYHLRTKMNKNHNSTRNKKTKRYMNHRKRNGIEEKDNEDKKHHYYLGRKMNKYSTRYNKTKGYKNKDEKKNRHMNKDKKLKKEKSTRAKRNRDKNHSKYSEHPKKDKDNINKKKQAKDKSKDKQREKSMDHHKHATTGAPMIISKTDVISLANENDHKHNKKPLLSKSDEKQREKSKHAINKSKTAIGVAGLGAAAAAGVVALVGKSLTSTKGPNPDPEHVLTSMTTSKPTTRPEPVQEQGVIRKKKLIKRERLNLRTKEKIRVTKIIPYSLKNEEDEAKKLRQGEEESKSSSAGSPPSYLSPYAIMAQMELLMKEFSDVNATVFKFSRTVEYNDIVLVSITANKDETNFRAKESKYIDDVPEKKIIFIVHGLTVMGLKDMTSLVKSSELKILLSYYFKHLDKFDFFLMPLANPDGYSASLSSDRAIWNKNVSPQSVCPGVFVDRNFDVAWNGMSKISSCSQLYPGASPFSEEESKAVRDVFHGYGHKILAYIHVHAGTFDEKVFKGDAILYPRGYTETQSDDDKYIDIKGEIDEAMKNASFRVITATVDTLSNWYGVVGGTSVDYAATVYGIPYAMEFVMQIYDSESMNNNALTEIWSRLIDATFNKMWKSLQAGGDA